MLSPHRILPLVCALLGLAVAAPGAGAATTLLRLDGIGPLKIGMSRADAVATGWLSHRSQGCELASPRPVSYRFDGPKAPRALDGSAEFVNGKLRVIAFAKGVRTATGVVVGQTTFSQMVQRYVAAHFLAASRYDSTFQGTFVTVRKRRKGSQVIGAFAEKRVITTIAVPAVPLCE